MLKLNGRVLNFKTFPNGETLIDGSVMTESLLYHLNDLELKYESDGDLTHLMFVKHHLDRLGVLCNLLIRYMPYSRQDRVEGDSVFTLRSVAYLINQMCFENVTVDEPHSDVTMALLDKSTAKYPTVELLPEVLEKAGIRPGWGDILFYPDAGAAKRYSSKIKHPFLVGYKVRDFETGKIKSLEVLGNTGDKDEPCGGKVLIVDDLCSYGGTFMLAGKALRRIGFTEVYLFVTHCEKSIFKGDLFNNSSPITKIFCTDSIITQEIIDKYSGITREYGEKIEIIGGER